MPPRLEPWLGDAAGSRTHARRRLSCALPSIFQSETGQANPASLPTRTTGRLAAIRGTLGRRARPRACRDGAPAPPRLQGRLWKNTPYPLQPSWPSGANPGPAAGAGPGAQPSHPGGPGRRRTQWDTAGDRGRCWTTFALLRRCLGQAGGHTGSARVRSLGSGRSGWGGVGWDGEGSRDEPLCLYLSLSAPPPPDLKPNVYVRGRAPHPKPNAGAPGAPCLQPRPPLLLSGTRQRILWLWFGSVLERGFIQNFVRGFWLHCWDAVARLPCGPRSQRGVRRRGEGKAARGNAPAEPRLH